MTATASSTTPTKPTTISAANAVPTVTLRTFPDSRSNHATRAGSPASLPKNRSSRAMNPQENQGERWRDV